MLKNAARKWGALNYFFKRRASYHFKAWKLRNLRAFEFFQLLTKFAFKLELQILKMSKLSLLVIPIKQLSFLNIANITKNDFSRSHLKYMCVPSITEIIEKIIEKLECSQIDQSL